MENKNSGFNTILVMLVGVIPVSCFLSFSFAKNNNQLIHYNNQITGTEIVTGMIFGSQKTITGTARIVKSGEDLNKIQSGDIVVTVMTHESWLPSLKKSSGIITNIGDENCHAALYGKNYSVPVLVGAGNATEKISDGYVITMDCSGLLGRVYWLEMEKKSYSSTTTTAVVAYNDSVSCHNHHIHSKKEHHSSKGADSYVLEQLEDHRSHIKKNVYITPELFHKEEKSFISYVLKMQNDISWRSWIGEKKMFDMARLIGGCGDFALRCIPLVYDFFDQDKRYIESIIKKIEMDYVNFLFEQYNQKPGDMEWLARVSHMGHVNKITLPHGIDRNELSKNPEKYKKIIDQKQVDPRERDVLIASGLFVRYCVEKKLRST